MTIYEQLLSCIFNIFKPRTSSRQKLISIVDNRRRRRVNLNSIPLIDTIKLRTLSLYVQLRVMLYSVTAVLSKLFLSCKTLEIVEKVANII